MFSYGLWGATDDFRAGIEHVKLCFNHGDVRAGLGNKGPVVVDLRNGVF